MDPPDAFLVIEGHEYWDKDLDMECRRRAAPMMPALVGWHNVEVFHLPCAMRNKR